jgi:hypothetical protein
MGVLFSHSQELLAFGVRIHGSDFRGKVQKHERAFDEASSAACVLSGMRRLAKV